VTSSVGRFDGQEIMSRLCLHGHVENVARDCLIFRNSRLMWAYLDNVIGHANHLDADL